MSVVKEKDYLPDFWVYCRGLELDFEEFLKIFNAVKKAGYLLMLPDFNEYCYQYIFKKKEEFRETGERGAKKRKDILFYISEKPEKGDNLRKYIEQTKKTIILWQNIQKKCFADLLKGKPKVFKRYVLQGIRIKDAPYATFTHAMRRYNHFCDLFIAFASLTLDLEESRKKQKDVEEIHVYMQARELLTVSKDLKVSVQKISSNIFDGLDLKRLYQCENCEDYYQAKKADKRNKFCSDACRNSLWEKINR